MIRVTISDTEVTTKNGTSKRTGNAYSMREQFGSIETPRYRVPVRLTLGDQQAPHAPGVYEIDFAKSIEVDRFGGLAFARTLSLVRVGDLAKKQAA